MYPTVSVLMPVYNGAAYLRQAVDSILQQDLQDLELIVVNDGSTDDTAAILSGIGDSRLKVLHNAKNSGIVITLNNGLDACTGRFIARMDADDIACPERLSRQVNVLEADPEIGVVDTVMTYIDENGALTGSSNEPIFSREAIYSKLPWRNCLGHSSIMARSTILQQFRYRQTPYEDYDLWLRIADSGVPIVKLQESLLLFRIHAASIVGGHRASHRSFLKIIETKRFYLRQLTFAAALRPFNLRVRIALLQDIATDLYKRLKARRNPA